MSGLLHHRLSGRPPGAAPTLLLIHPMGAALDFWDACLPVWEPDFTCLAVDLRSAGASPRGDGPPGIDRHVADLEALRSTLGLARLLPIACAVGTMVAAAYAARHPDRTAALILSNPTPATSEAARAMLQARAESVRADGMAAILPGAVERPFEAQPRDARYQRYLTAFAAQDAAAYADAVDGFATADVRDDLARIRCPTLLVPAAHDPLLPPALAEEFQRLMPTGLARIEIDAEGAHFLPYQRPAEFAARARRFIASLSGES